MIAIDQTLDIRRAVLALLKADVALIDLVPASSIWPQSPPADRPWPFIRYGAPSITPFAAPCARGGDTAGVLHAFAKLKRNQAGAPILSAEDHAAMIGAAIVNAVDRRSIELPQGTARIRWAGSQLLADPAEPDAYHAVINIRVRSIA